MGPSHFYFFSQSHDICPNYRASSLLKRTRTKKFQIQTKFLKHLSLNFFPSFISETLGAMSNPISPTLGKVIGKIMEDVQGERVEQLENQETTLVQEVREEVKEVESDSRGVEKFLTNKGAEIFKKRFIGEREFKELVPPFREEIERKGWELLYKLMEKNSH